MARGRVTGAMRRRVFSKKRKQTTAPTGSYKRRKLGSFSAFARRVNNLSRMIETKTGQWSSPTNVALPHNNVYIVQTSAGGDLNPLATGQSSSDPMIANTGARIGDRITIKGMSIKGMVECALQRPKVHFRIMLVKCPRGVAPTRAELFQGCSANKMIDTVNSEKFTIVWQTKFNVSTSNNAPGAYQAGVNPNAAGVVTASTPAGIGVKTFSAWIPGKKFGKRGNLQYENGSTTPKFFDYRLVYLCYDWYGTPQDSNNVGILNEMYTKIYFKDA